MKFKFCGDQDAPDWVLAEITTISKIVKPRLTCRAGHFDSCVTNSRDVLLGGSGIHRNYLPAISELSEHT
jgi:hypothetical protein